MFEKDLPGRETKTFATKVDDIGELPLEVCETINGTWGFNLKDDKHKSKKKIIQYLVKAAGYNSNLLLNVGPMPNGRIQKEHISVLKDVGDWLKIYGKTIYNTRCGPIKTTDEIASTESVSITERSNMSETMSGDTSGFISTLVSSHKSELKPRVVSDFVFCPQPMCKKVLFIKKPLLAEGRN